MLKSTLLPVVVRAPLAATCLLSLVPSVVHSTEDSATERLTLKAVIARALQNNNDISVDNLGRVIELEKIKAAKLPFTTHVDGSYVYQNIRTPQNTQDYVATGGGTASPTNPAQPFLASPSVFEQMNHVAKLSVANKLLSGTTLELGTTMRVLDNTLNRKLPPSLFNPEWESFTGLTLTQPLLRDWGIRANSAEIRIAKANAKLADLEWQARTAEVVSQVMKRYYDVVFAIENTKVQRDSIALAQKLTDDTKKRSKEGVATNNDVAIAEAGVYQRTEEALAAEMQYVERQNVLQLLFKKADEVMAQGARVEPVDGLAEAVEAPKRADLMRTAMMQRYELKQADAGISSKAAQVDFAKNQSRPRLDLVASGGMHGLEGSLGGTYDRAANGQGPEWTAGMQFSVPLGFDKLRATRRIAQGQESQAYLQREKVRLQVALEVDTAFSRLRSDEQRLDATKKSREAAALSAEAELKRLGEGVTTSYQVLQLQKEYSQARSRELAARTELNKDLVDVWLSTGTLLEKQGIVVTGDKPVMTEAIPALAPVVISKSGKVIPVAAKADANSWVWPWEKKSKPAAVAEVPVVEKSKVIAEPVKAVAAPAPSKPVAEKIKPVAEKAKPVPVAAKPAAPVAGPPPLIRSWLGRLVRGSESADSSKTR